jgi:thioredoxin 1
MDLIELNPEEFLEKTKTGAALVLFYTDWCPLCPELIALLENLSEEYRGTVPFYKIDFEKSLDLAEDLAVPGVPTAAGFQNGRLADLRPGMREEAAYRDMANLLKNWEEARA